MNHPEYKNYDCTLATLSQTLDLYGVAVIPNVLTLNECTSAYNLLWKELGDLTSKM